MGTETMEWYNTQILVGMTAQRGKAWHWKADEQGAEPNHYPNAIPVADVHRRLFSWEALAQPIFYTGADGQLIEAEDRCGIVRSDTNTLFGVFSKSYSPHQYGQWLVQNLETMIDDDIAIGSAGLLKEGAVAWVSLEMPESIEVLEGFKIRPHLLATTSHNGSIATTYKKVTTFVVCDNTYSIAMGEDGEHFRLRHSKYSQMRIQSARDALGIVHKMTSEMKRHIRMLSMIKVDQNQFNRILDVMAPIPKTTNKMSLTRAENKRNSLLTLYRSDERVAAWKGTGLAVLQAFNTYYQHESGTDKNRLERNMMGTLMGTAQAQDKKVLALLGV